jgi:hypothetical protein
MRILDNSDRPPLIGMAFAAHLLVSPVGPLAMTEELVQKIKMVLERSLLAKTSVCYSPDAAASYGQYAPTAIVMREVFGGRYSR